MVMTITNFWNIFHYRFKRYHYKNVFSNREFLERLALECFNDRFSTDTRTPENNIPPLDEVDEVEIVSTCRALHFSSMLLLKQRSELLTT